MPERKRPTKKNLEPPSEDVREKQNPDQTEADFLRDLDRASTDDAKKRLADPSERRRGSSRT